MSPAETVDEVLQATGRAIRTRRQDRGLSIAELARQCGLSRPFVSQVERGQARPSMASLTALAEALGTSAHMLLAGAGEGTYSVVRREESSSFMIGHTDGQARVLFRGRHSMLPVEYRSGPVEFQDFFVHQGEEFVYVCEGEFEVELEGHGLHRLGPGDTLFYRGGVRHRWRVLSEGPVCMVLVQQADE